MALTAFPDIRINASTGSDTLSSGAGPGDGISSGAAAITGTATASNSTTIALVVSTGTLSDVAQDGSATIWINGVGEVRISTRDTIGITVLVETAVTCTAANFAIGGKRATINGTESLRLFAATSSPTAVGGTGQWTITIEDATISTGAAIALAFAAGTGYFKIRGSSASSRCIWTQTASVTHFTMAVSNKLMLENIEFRNSHGTPLEVITSSQAPEIYIKNVRCGNNTGTNCPKSFCVRTASSITMRMENSSILRTTNVGVSLGNGNFFMDGSEIARCGGDGTSGGVSGGTGTYTIKKSAIVWNTGIGLNISSTGNVDIDMSVIDNNTADGIKDTGATLTASISITNSQITNNGTSGTAYGLNLSFTQPHYPRVEYCNFSGNRTAAANGFTLSATNLTIDPGYTDPTSSVRNYAVGTAMKAAGFPASTDVIAASQGGCINYVDIGMQRQELPFAYAS